MNTIDKILEVEQSVVGKSYLNFKNNMDDKLFTLLSLSLSLYFSIHSFMNYILDEQFSNNWSTIFQISNSSSLKIFIFALIASTALFFALFFTISSLFKLTFIKSPISTSLGLISSWIIFLVANGLGHFILVEADWDVVWQGRLLLLFGQQMFESVTQSYYPNQSWRLWLVLYLIYIIIPAAYGTTKDNPIKFIIYFGIFSIITFWAAVGAPHVYPANYNQMTPASNIIGATILAYSSYFLSYRYCINSEEYKANRLRSYLALGAVFVFFFAIFIMNPPESIQELCASVFGISSDNIQLSRCGGVEASQWGGLFVNLLVATAGCVLGFGFGVILAFGRQSKLPFFKYPAVALIETVRSGPLICWLYFAVFLLPDIIDPFMEVEDIIRMLLIFGLFGGCYIAEVLRGGLQAVDSGQKEAALALGLSPMQTKLQVELPNAVRTTLPSIVSVFIGLWKDTTLLFIINILDFFKLAKDLPNTSPGYLDDFLEPVYITALIFWVFAFYLSRISMRIEKSLGLTNEGGGEAA